MLFSTAQLTEYHRSWEDIIRDRLIKTEILIVYTNTDLTICRPK